jgi:site-specific DNA-methyltransferase (adenine-specific)
MAQNENKMDRRAPRNRTITLTSDEMDLYKQRLIRLQKRANLADVLDKTIHQNTFEALDHLPDKFVDLLFADPPYNLSKTFNEQQFQKISRGDYERWLDSWISKTVRLLKQTASIYICGDWRSSSAVYNIGTKYFKVQNRITWEREKGRGAARNWKNCSEDIWFFTMSDEYTFNLESVMLKRQVIAPYTKENGEPKDWDAEADGRFRLTRPSNLWTDLTVPFWSMPENTEHPTQKPEKLLAKIILASTNEADVVLDPFLGSGTTSVAARKLKRHYVGIEADEKYCCLAEKRLELAMCDAAIQGYSDGVFWERNTLALQSKNRNRKTKETIVQQQTIF